MRSCIKNEVNNPTIIILGRWPKKREVWNPIIILGGLPKRKWGQESHHRSSLVTEKENEVRNLILILGAWPKRKRGQESYHTQKESEVRNSIIILGSDPKRKWGQDRMESYHHKRKWGQESYHHCDPKKKVRSGILSSFLAGDQKTKFHWDFVWVQWRMEG